MPTLKRLNQLFGMRVKKLTKQVGHADLTDADTQQAIDFDSALPTNAFVIGAMVDITTAMSGGSVSACTADLGIKSGDTDGFLDAADIFTGAVDVSTPRGVALPGFHGGATPTIIVDSTDDNLVNLTAGDVTFVVFYIDIGKVKA